MRKRKRKKRKYRASNHDQDDFDVCLVGGKDTTALGLKALLLYASHGEEATQGHGQVVLSCRKHCAGSTPSYCYMMPVDHLVTPRLVSEKCNSSIHDAALHNRAVKSVTAGENDQLSKVLIGMRLREFNRSCGEGRWLRMVEEWAAKVLGCILLLHAMPTLWRSDEEVL